MAQTAKSTIYSEDDHGERPNRKEWAPLIRETENGPETAGKDYPLKAGKCFPMPIPCRLQVLKNLNQTVIIIIPLRIIFMKDLLDLFRRRQAVADGRIVI